MKNEFLKKEKHEKNFAKMSIYIFFKKIECLRFIKKKLLKRNQNNKKIQGRKKLQSISYNRKNTRVE